MGTVLYSKQALKLEDQLSLLEKRGVLIEDSSFARQVLETVSYYRFTAYLYPFRQNDSTNNYVPGTSFNYAGNITVLTEN